MRTQVLSYRALDNLEVDDKVWFDETTGYVTKANWPFDTANLFHGIALRNIIIGEFITKDVDIRLTGRGREEEEDRQRREEKKLDKR